MGFGQFARGGSGKKTGRNSKSDKSPLFLSCHSSVADISDYIEKVPASMTLVICHKIERFLIFGTAFAFL